MEVNKINLELTFNPGPIMTGITDKISGASLILRSFKLSNTRHNLECVLRLLLPETSWHFDMSKKTIFTPWLMGLFRR